MPLLETGAFALTAQALNDLGLKGTLALVPSWQVGLEQPAPTDFNRLASDGFRSNEVVYACVREIASTAAEVALRVVDHNDQPLPDHPLQQLLDRPNPELSTFELIEALLTDLLVYGNAFLLKERDPLTRSAPRSPNAGAAGRPDTPSTSGRPVLMDDAVRALWKLRPDRIRIVPGSRRLVQTYVHRVGERETKLAPRDVIHFRLADPTNDLWGLSPIQVAARQIDTDNEASKFVEAFFRNAAVPFGVIKLKRTLRGGEPEVRYRTSQRIPTRPNASRSLWSVAPHECNQTQRVPMVGDQLIVN